jgi:hypothetical protein
MMLNPLNLAHLNRMDESKADMITLNLEDAIAPSRKQEALDNVALFLSHMEHSDSFIIKEASKTNIYGYLIKPFDFYNEKIDLGDGFVFDVRNKQLLKNGEAVHLKAKVARLLDLFIRHKGEVLSKEKIFDEIYDFDETPNVDSLRTFIKTLRNILGNDKIETIKEVGYRFVG